MALRSGILPLRYGHRFGCLLLKGSSYTSAPYLRLACRQASKHACLLKQQLQSDRYSHHHKKISGVCGLFLLPLPPCGTWTHMAKICAQTKTDKGVDSPDFMASSYMRQCTRHCMRRYMRTYMRYAAWPNFCLYLDSCLLFAKRIISWFCLFYHLPRLLGRWAVSRSRSRSS